MTADTRIQEVKQGIRNKVEWRFKDPPKTGGQSCGVMVKPITLTSQELQLEITINSHRSQLKNKELAFTLFELVLDEIIK